MTTGEFKETGLSSSGQVGERTADAINERIRKLLAGNSTSIQIETIFEDIGEAVDNFKITDSGAIDAALIFSLLDRYLHLGGISSSRQKLHRIFYHIGILAWTNYLSDLDPKWYGLLNKCGSACTNARESASYLLLLSRLIDEGYFPTQNIPKSLLLELCLGRMCSDETCDTVSISRALHALVLLESSGVEISSALKEKGLALVKQFEEILAEDKNSEISADQIQRVAQHLWLVHGKDPEGLLLKKLEELCKPIPNELQLFLEEKFKTNGYPLCVPEGRIGSNFCDLVILIPNKGKRNKEKFKKVVIELDGGLHYDENGKLIEKDQQRDDKLRAKGVIIRRIKTFDQQGKKKSKLTIYNEVLKNLQHISSHENTPRKKQGTQEPQKEKLSNPFGLLDDEDKAETSEMTQEESLQEGDPQSLAATEEPEDSKKALDKKQSEKETPEDLPFKPEKASRSSKKIKVKKEKKNKNNEKLQKVKPVEKTKSSEPIPIPSRFPSRVSRRWFEKLEKMAAKKIPCAVNMLGFIYHYGYTSDRFVIKQDFDKAFELFSEAADLGYPSSYVNLADYYLQGHVVTQNTDQGVRRLERAAALGVVEARYVLGTIYTSPEYPYVLASNAMQYINKAQKHIVIYTSNLPKEEEVRQASLLKAQDVIRKIAIVKAKFNKPGETKDFLKKELKELAPYSMELPLTKNLSTSEKFTGSLTQHTGNLAAVFPTEKEWEDLIQGKTVKRFNKTWFRQLVSLAVDDKSAVAMRILGVLYDKGYQNKKLVIKQNYEKAFNFFSDAARCGEPIATSNVGAYYIEGHYVQKDLVRGVGFLEKAAELGNLPARIKIASIYLLPQYAHLGDPAYLEKAEVQAQLVKKHFDGDHRAAELVIYQQAEAVLRMVAGMRGNMKLSREAKSFHPSVSFIETQTPVITLKDNKETRVTLINPAGLTPENKMIENPPRQSLLKDGDDEMSAQPQDLTGSIVNPLPSSVARSTSDNKNSGDHAFDSESKGEPDSLKETMKTKPYSDFWKHPKTLAEHSSQPHMGNDTEHQETQNVETEEAEEATRDEDSENPEKPSCWRRTQCYIL